MTTPCHPTTTTIPKPCHETTTTWHPSTTLPKPAETTTTAPHVTTTTSAPTTTTVVVTTVPEDDSYPRVEQTQYSGTSETLLTTTTVAQMPATPALAYTGSDTGVLVAVAVGMFLIGAAFTRLSRKVTKSS